MVRLVHVDPEIPELAACSCHLCGTCSRRRTIHPLEKGVVSSEERRNGHHVLAVGNRILLRRGHNSHLGHLDLCLSLPSRALCLVFCVLVGTSANRPHHNPLLTFARDLGNWQVVPSLPNLGSGGHYSLSCQDSIVCPKGG